MKKLLMIILSSIFLVTSFGAVESKESRKTEEKTCSIKTHTRFEKIQNTVAFVSSSGAYMLWTQECLCADPIYKKMIGVIGVINIALTGSVMLKDWKWYVAYLKAITQPQRESDEKQAQAI